MSWITLSLLALITFVVYDVLGRYFANKSANPQAFATIYNFAVALISPILFVFDSTIPSNLDPKVIGLTVLGCILWGLNGRYEYFAKKHTEASVFAITMKIAPVVNFVLSLYFLRETGTLQKYLGILLIITANMLLYLGNKGKIISTQGLKYTLFLAINLSFAWLLDAANIKHWGIATFSIISFAAGGIISGIFPIVKLVAIKRELRLTPIWQIFLLGAANLIGYAFMLKALTLGEASNVMPIVTSTTPFVVLAGILFLGERDSYLRKIVSALITIFAVYLMR